MLPAFLPAFLVADFLVVGCFSEPAPLSVVLFFARRVALPEARLAAAFFVVVLVFFGAALLADVSSTSMSMPKTDDSSSD